MFAIVSNNQVIKYPADPAADNPHVSFPIGWGGGDIGDNTYVPVSLTNIPSCNLGWTYTETTPVNTANGWVQAFTTTILPNDQLATAVTSKRYEVEVGGVMVSNNSFATDRESQTKYIAIAV